MSVPGFLNRHALILLLVVAFAVHLAAVATFQHGYISVDGGAYLIGVRQTFDRFPWLQDICYRVGDGRWCHDTSGITGPGLPRLILGPGLLLWPFVEAFGTNMGMRVFAASASLLPIAAAYLLANRIAGRTVALIACAFLTFDLWESELMVSGADPLIGFALLLVAMWAVLECHRVRGRVVLAAAIVLIAHTSMTSAGIALLVLPVWTVAWWCFDHWGFNRRQITCESQFLQFCWYCSHFAIKDVALPAAVGVVLSLTALPWYLPQAFGGAATAYTGPLWLLAPLWDSGWQMIAWEIPVGLYVLFHMKGASPGLKSLMVVLLVSLPVLLSQSYDESVLNIEYRVRHFSMILFWIGLAACIKVWWPRIAKQRVFQAWLFGGFAFLAVLFFVSTYQERRTAQAVSMESLHAIRIIKRAPAGIITNAGGLSFWLGALVNQPSFYVQVSPPPSMFVQDYERMRCVMGWRPDPCDPIAAAQAMNMGYVMLDRHIYEVSWRLPPIYGAPKPDPWANMEALPWLVNVYQGKEVTLWRVVPPSP